MAKAPVDSDLDLTQEVVRLQNRVAELEQALAEG
jgi:hypothetical protein